MVQQEVQEIQGNAAIRWHRRKWKEQPLLFVHGQQTAWFYYLFTETVFLDGTNISEEPCDASVQARRRTEPAELFCENVGVKLPCVTRICSVFILSSTNK